MNGSCYVRRQPLPRVWDRWVRMSRVHSLFIFRGSRLRPLRARPELSVLQISFTAKRRWLRPAEGGSTVEARNLNAHSTLNASSSGKYMLKYARRSSQRNDNPRSYLAFHINKAEWSDMFVFTRKTSAAYFQDEHIQLIFVHVLNARFKSIR